MEKSEKSHENRSKREIKEISVTPFLTKLFTPSAELLGTELRDYLRGKIDSWKEKKRGENVVGHINKVQERIGKDQAHIHIEQENIEQLDLFSEWVSGAQDVDLKWTPIAGQFGVHFS